ncbi:MAG TPA: hypothetical protein VFI47_25265 [Acidimicrobiales bacterium]|nr:hypothetical protein [Acidimicrobiales bacterium]
MLLGLLLVFGWGHDAWATAAGFLFVACVAVCVWAEVQGRTTDREVRRAVDQLAASRDRARLAPRRARRTNP